MSAYKILLVIIALLHISSCSQMSPQSAQTHIIAQSLQDFPQQWSIHGRMSIINEQENWYMKFIWLQKDEDFQISFMGPLGETELLVTHKDEVTQLKTPSYVRSTDDVEQLLYNETGWRLPVSSLRYWSYGMPNPDMETQIKYDESAYISELFQENWHIQYPKRIQVGRYYLPKKIIVTEQNLKIKIIISQWDLEHTEMEFKK